MRFSPKSLPLRSRPILKPLPRGSLAQGGGLNYRYSLPPAGTNFTTFLSTESVTSTVDVVRRVVPTKALHRGEDDGSLGRGSDSALRRKDGRELRGMGGWGGTTLRGGVETMNTNTNMKVDVRKFRRATPTVRLVPSGTPLSSFVGPEGTKVVSAVPKGVREDAKP